MPEKHMQRCLFHKCITTTLLSVWRLKTDSLLRVCQYCEYCIDIDIDLTSGKGVFAL